MILWCKYPGRGKLNIVVENNAGSRPFTLL